MGGNKSRIGAALVLYERHDHGQGVSHLCGGSRGAESVYVVLWLREDMGHKTLSMVIQQNDDSRGGHNSR